MRDKLIRVLAVLGLAAFIVVPVAIFIVGKKFPPQNDNQPGVIRKALVATEAASISRRVIMHPARFRVVQSRWPLRAFRYG